MKVRSDFVTNSSSSSFILADSDAIKYDVDSAFQLITALYREYIANVDKLKRDMGKYHLSFEKDMFMYPKGYSWDAREKQDAQIRSKYNIDTWDRVLGFEPWMNFSTYNEYQDYWVNKIKESNGYAPFSIFDFSNPDPKYMEVESGYTIFDSKSTPEDLNSHIIGWYAECVEDRISGVFDMRNWDYCNTCHFRPKFGASCRKLSEKIDKSAITLTNCVSMLLGNVCILSDCGNLPDAIVDKLRQLSVCSCNHMG